MRRFIFCGLFCLLIVSLSGCTKSISMEIIAHRGASYLAPENTLASAKLAWEKGADAVEIDVYLSKDNRIVVIHDSNTARTAGASLMVGKTESSVLRRLDVGSWKGEEFVGERIPFLEEIIKTIPRKGRLFVEIKCGREILPTLRQIIIRSGKASQIVIIGFGLETVTASKELMPKIPTYWVKRTDKDEKTEERLPHDTKLIQTVREKGLDGLDVHYAGVTRDFMDAVKISGQKLYVWTVDDPEEAIRLDRLGVSGITTNRPLWLRERLQNYKK